MFEVPFGDVSVRHRRRAFEKLQNKKTLKSCGAANIQIGWWMNVEQPQQRLPFNGGERTLAQNVSQPFCGTHTSS